MVSFPCHMDAIWWHPRIDFVKNKPSSDQYVRIAATNTTTDNWQQDYKLISCYILCKTVNKEQRICMQQSMMFAWNHHRRFCWRIHNLCKLTYIYLWKDWKVGTNKYTQVEPLTLYTERLERYYGYYRFLMASKWILYWWKKFFT